MSTPDKDRARPVAVNLLGRQYQFSCPDSERNLLDESSRLFDARLREVKDHGMVIGLERIAIMAGLNLAQDLVRAKNDSSAGEAIADDLGRLCARIDGQLARFGAGADSGEDAPPEGAP